MTEDEGIFCKDTFMDALPSFPGTLFLNDSVKFDEEPEAPTVSLGEKVVWVKDTEMEIGVIKWIGRIPLICSNWTAGVEFENPIGHGNGELNGRRYFSGKEDYVMFMPMIGLLRQEDYNSDNDKAESARVQSVTEILLDQGNDLILEDPTLAKTENHYISISGDKGKANENESAKDLTEKRTISSLLNRSLQRSTKKKAHKRSSLIPSDNKENAKFKNIRKTSLNSVSSYSAGIDDGWPVIDSDSEIDYKGGIHVLMSCFTLGTLYRKRKTNSTSEYQGNKTDIFISYPNYDCVLPNVVAEQSNVKDNIGISNSLSSVSNDVACCNSPSQTLEKNSVRCKKRRKKKKAPLPPCSPIPTTNSILSVNSKSVNKIDDLPDVIGKLYVFNKSTQQNKQRERDSHQNVSVLCQGRYARVIEEKSLKNDITSEQNVSLCNLVVTNHKSAKRKSAKKRPAPQPPQIISTTLAEAKQQESNKKDNVLMCNGSKLYHIDDCKPFADSRECFKNINLGADQIQPLTTVNFNNLHPTLIKCSCVTCNKDNNTAIFLPHVVCPTLPDAESSNITVLGYCNVDKRSKTVLIQNSKALLQSNNSHVTIPAANNVKYIHCAHCPPSSINMIKQNTFRKYCANGECSADSEEEHSYRYFNMPFDQTNKSYQCERSTIDYLSHTMVEERRNYDDNYLDNRERNRRHHYSNVLQNGSSYKRPLVSHSSAADLYSFSNSHCMYEENSSNCENHENYSLWERKTSNKIYTSAINNVLPKRKTKLSRCFSDSKSFKHSENELDGLQDLIKSRPSVKDFIAAFNYLTQKTNSDLDFCSDNGEIHHSTYLNGDEITEEPDMKNNFDLKSLPTKWRYSPIETDKKLMEREGCAQFNGNLLPPKRNKNRRVTFKKGTKSETKPAVNLHILKDANIKYKMQQHVQKSTPCTSKVDINMPYKHSVSMAHRHRHNQQLITVDVKHDIPNQVGCSNRNNAVHNGNSSKQINLTKPDKVQFKSSQNAKQPGYRKTYRAPPIPDHSFSPQKEIDSSHVKVTDYKKYQQKYETKHLKEHEIERNKSIDDKIWVSLYIEDRSSHKGLIPLLLSPTMTVKMLKIKLERQFGYPRDLQRWILGKSFVTDDNATLASYNVTEAGCPIFLYMTAKDLPNDYEALSDAKSTNQNQDTSTDESDSDLTDSDSGTVILASDTEQESSESSTKSTAEVMTGHLTREKIDSPTTSNPRKSKVEEIRKKYALRKNLHKQKAANKTSEIMRENYNQWMEIAEKDLISNLEPFECPVCFLDVSANAGVMLKECLHLFCRECLSNAVYYAEEAVIKCPFRNDEYSCDSHLQEREIKALVSPEVYERHLQRSIAAAESQAHNSFHCKSPDCPGWCLYEDKVNLFLCPVCGHLNCLTCQAIHEGRNCRQYQDELEFNSTTSDEAKKTKDYLDNMLKEGEAIRCPQCHIILMKKWGCDWLKCSVCLTEVCWVTKGRRWGPSGRGDTSGGCRCGVDGVKCHPKCNYCH